MNINSIKFWSFFWRDGIIILFPIELGLILLIPNLNSIWIFILWGITFIIGGLDYIIASIYKMPHIYCVNQSMNHQLITYNPYEMDWKNNFDKKEMIRLGIILIILGVISISGGIIIYLC